MHYLKKKKTQKTLQGMLLVGSRSVGRPHPSSTAAVFLYAQFLNCLCKRDHSVAS